MTDSMVTCPGSCHCGKVQYQVRLRFPPVTDPNVKSIRIYKCNCTLCQKMGYFHCRPISPADDFIVTSPATIEDLGDYRRGLRQIGFYFCKDCACHVFAISGVWKQVDLDMGAWSGAAQSSTESARVQKVWTSTPPPLATTDGETTGYHYTSVNAVTLEPSVHVDLKLWHDEGWVSYVENWKREGGKIGSRNKPPFEGGMY